MDNSHNIKELKEDSKAELKDNQGVKWFKWLIISILIISFALTGINSLFTNDDPNIIASVGKQKISKEEFIREYQNHIYYLQNIFQFRLTEEQLKQLNLTNMVLNHLIQEKILKELFLQMKFAISDAAAIDNIKNAAIFSSDNKFKREKFLDFLEKAELSETQYLEKIKFDIARDIFFSNFFEINWDSETTAKKLYKNIYQKRIVGLVKIPRNSLIKLETPSVEELEKFYNNYSNDKDNNSSELNPFYTKEYRTASYITVSAENIKPEAIQISSEEIENKFNELALNKKFNIEYIIFDNKQEAEKAWNSIENNLDFYQKDIQSFKNKGVNDLPLELQENVKASIAHVNTDYNDYNSSLEVSNKNNKVNKDHKGQENAINKASTENSWKIIPVEDFFYLIKISNIHNISQIEKEKLAKEIKRSLSASKIERQLESLIENIEEDLGKINISSNNILANNFSSNSNISAKLEEIAKKHGASYHHVPLVDKEGNYKSSKDSKSSVVSKNEDRTLSPLILKEIFAQNKAEVKAFRMIGRLATNIYVEDIQEPALQPFDEQKVKEIWQQTYTENALAELAAKQATTGQAGQELTFIRPSIAIGENSKQEAPNEFIEEIFTLKEGQVSKGYKYNNNSNSNNSSNNSNSPNDANNKNNNSYYIAGKLIRVETPEDNELKITEIKAKLKQDLSLSLISELIEYYRKQFKVKINYKILNNIK